MITAPSDRYEEGEERGYQGQICPDSILQQVNTPLLTTCRRYYRKSKGLELSMPRLVRACMRHNPAGSACGKLHHPTFRFFASGQQSIPEIL